MKKHKKKKKKIHYALTIGGEPTIVEMKFKEWFLEAMRYPDKEVYNHEQGKEEYMDAVRKGIIPHDAQSVVDPQAMAVFADKAEEAGYVHLPILLRTASEMHGKVKPGKYPRSPFVQDKDRQTSRRRTYGDVNITDIYPDVIPGVQHHHVDREAMDPYYKKVMIDPITGKTKTISRTSYRT